jgi:hypothetical protein
VERSLYEQIDFLRLVHIHYHPTNRRQKKEPSVTVPEFALVTDDDSRRNFVTGR